MPLVMHAGVHTEVTLHLPLTQSSLGSAQPTTLFVFNEPEHATAGAISAFCRTHAKPAPQAPPGFELEHRGTQLPSLHTFVGSLQEAEGNFDEQIGVWHPTLVPLAGFARSKHANPVGQKPSGLKFGASPQSFFVHWPMTQEPPSATRALCTLSLQHMRSISPTGFGHAPPGLSALHGGTSQPPFAHTQFWPAGQQVLLATHELTQPLPVQLQLAPVQAAAVAADEHGSVGHNPPG